MKAFSLTALAATLLAFSAACASHGPYPPRLQAPGTLAFEPAPPGPQGDDEGALALDEAYHDLLEAHTQRVRAYKDRFDSPVAYWATYLSWPLQVAQMRSKGRRERWDETRWNDTLEKARERAGKSFLFYLDFYSYEYDENQVGVTPKDPWKVFLVLPDGTRIGAAQTRHLRPEESEMEWLYPRHTRFAELYEVEFPAEGVQLAEGDKVQLEVTGLPYTSATAWALSNDPGALPPQP